MEGKRENEQKDKRKTKEEVALSLFATSPFYLFPLPTLGQVLYKAKRLTLTARCHV
jgi:hypothetical protein